MIFHLRSYIFFLFVFLSFLINTGHQLGWEMLLYPMNSVFCQSTEHSAKAFIFFHTLKYSCFSSELYYINVSLLPRRLLTFMMPTCIPNRYGHVIVFLKGLLKTEYEL